MSDLHANTAIAEDTALGWPMSKYRAGRYLWTINTGNGGKSPTGTPKLVVYFENCKFQTTSWSFQNVLHYNLTQLEYQISYKPLFFNTNQ